MFENSRTYGKGRRIADMNTHFLFTNVVSVHLKRNVILNAKKQKDIESQHYQMNIKNRKSFRTLKNSKPLQKNIT